MAPVDKLTNGAHVADVGCGHEASTILMAQAFPKSTFVAVDYHGASIETAQQRAATAGVANVHVEVAGPTSYNGRPYDGIADANRLRISRQRLKQIRAESDQVVAVLEELHDELNRPT